jgi:hypothetical protein
MNRRPTAIFLSAAVLLAGIALARPNGLNGTTGVNGRHETLYYHLDPAPLAWADSRMNEMLEREFSRSARIELVNAISETSGLPTFPADYTDNQAIFDWGTEVGARYVLIVDVDGEYIETRKTFKLPLIFHRYETFGVVEGEIRLIDLERRRLLIADRFKVQKKSGEAFQATPDDNKNDPDLHIDAPRKVRFFRELEDNAAAYIARRVGAYVRR